MQSGRNGIGWVSGIGKEWEDIALFKDHDALADHVSRKECRREGRSAGGRALWGRGRVGVLGGVLGGGLGTDEAAGGSGKGERIRA